MTQDYPHPITPPPELVQQWADAHFAANGWLDASGDGSGVRKVIATRAAQWGSDQELEACLQHLDAKGHHPTVLDALRAARRPKPPSLKEEALEALEEIGQVGSALVRSRSDTIRKALEQLDD